MAWQLQEAKQRFSEVVHRAQTAGPQVVTKHGRAAVVIVSVQEYRSLQADEPDLIEFIRTAPDFDVLPLDRASDAPRRIEL